MDNMNKFNNLVGLIFGRLYEQHPLPAHLSGAIAGLIIAILFRDKGPQAKKYNYELEEELEQERKDIDINYIYKPEE